MWRLYDERVETITALTRRIRKELEKGTIDDLTKDLREVLSNSWKKSVRESLIAALDTISNVNGALTAAEMGMIIEDVKDILAMPVEQAVRKQLVDIQKAAYIMGAVGAAGSGVKIKWFLPDQKSLQVLNRDLLFWVGSHYDDNLSEAFKATLQDFFNAGYTRDEMAKLLKHHFKDLGEKSDAYWDLLADHTCTKTREIGRVAGYEKAGVEVIRIKAHLDERTTEVCRRLHGQVVAVKAMRSHIDTYLAACATKNKEKIKAAWPWITDEWSEKNLTNPKAVQRQVRRGVVGMPPYHARCRTITVAEFMVDAGERVVDGDEGQLISEES